MLRAAWLSGLLCGVLAMVDRPRPSVLLIHADDLGYGDLGSYGHPTSVTPNIDRLATDGLRFTQFYSASPVCSPSRAGLLTGRFPARVGAYCDNNTDACAATEMSGTAHCCVGVWEPGMPGGVPTTQKTLGTFFKQLGYRTGAIGKWHLGGMEQHAPSQFGFDEYFGCPHGLGACPLAACFCPNEGCAIAGHSNWTGCPIYANETIVTQPLDMLSVSGRYISAAASFIGRAAANGEQFFLYYASHHVHSPQFAGGDTTNTTARGRFGDSLAELDASVGHLMALVANFGMPTQKMQGEQTPRQGTVDTSGGGAGVLTVLTSDNGPSLRNEVRGGNAGLLRCGKGTTFEGGTRVPLLVHWPGQTPTAAIVRGVMTSLDLLPTLVTIAGGSVPAGWVLDGVPAPDLLLGASEDSPRNGEVVYFPQFAQQSRGVNGSGIYAARAGRWKAHWITQGSLQSGTSSPNADPLCGPSAAYTVLTTPLVFDIDIDPSEAYPLDPTTGDYAEGLAAATAVAQRHAARMEWWEEPLLTAGPWSARGQPCCNPGCTPFPSCCRCDKDGPDPPPAEPCAPKRQWYREQ